jgi:radical SAM protein with 4Fe4S-binding SPASM domain
MDTAEASDFIKNLKAQNNFRSIGFIGSEPFVRDDLEELLGTAVALDLSVSVQTNSTLLKEERLNIWARHGGAVKIFGASLEGLAGVDDSIRTGKDVFNRASNGIRLAVAAGLPVTVSILLLDENRRQIPELIKYLSTLGVKAIDVSLVVNHSRTDIEETVKLSGLEEKDICITSKSELGYKTPSEVLLDDLRSGLDLGRKLGMKVSTSPDSFLDHYHEIRDGSIRRKRRLTCGALNTVRVDPSGWLIHCQHFRHSFGDLRKTGIKEAWNSDEYRTFRQRLIKNNLFPICVDCYRMKVLDS